MSARRTACGLAAAVLLVATGVGSASARPLETAGTRAGLPAGYAAARTSILRDGNAVVALVRKGDADALYARFTPAFRKRVSLAEVRAILLDLRGDGAIGAPTGVSALPLAAANRGYLADLPRTGATPLSLTVSFDAQGQITSIGLGPRRALPPDPHAADTVRTPLRLPLAGTWWVFWGGPTERQNYHVVAPDQRHALDLVVWRRGATYRGAGTRNVDYWAFDQPVVAPADATVIEVVDGVRDNRPQVQVENRAQPAGNHVVLRLADGEYALLAHLRRGTVRVREGQLVRRGQALGRTGNSGNSSEPHLHFHVQDGPVLFGTARGLPVRFTSLRVDGRRFGRAAALQGRFVEHGG